MKKDRLIIINILVTVVMIICMSSAVYAEGKIDFSLSQNSENALPGPKLETTSKIESTGALDSNLTATLQSSETSSGKTFTDLAGYEWAKMQIESLAAQGIIAGTSATTFSPGNNITRADFICLLVRTLKLTAEVDSNFNDVVPSDYFYNEVGTAKKLGITLGTGDNRFKPRENISRQDMMVIVARAMKIAGMELDESASDISRFQDSGEVAPYALSAVAQLINEEIIVGSNGRIDPKGTVTRAQTAVIMYKLWNRLEGSRGSPDQETGTTVPKFDKQQPELSSGYRAVCYDGDAFIAVGTNGRIDRIKPDKTVTGLSTVTNVCLNSVISMDGIDVAVGDGGVVLIAKDGGSFKTAKSSTTKSLYGVTIFRDTFLAAGADGTLICSADGEQWTSIDSGIKNDIISISANERMCMAVTRESQILMSVDGQKWDVLDYNAYYEGYAEPCRFRSVRSFGNMFYIAGEYLNYPGKPAILSSDTGEIWLEHILIKINDSPGEEHLPLMPNAFAIDSDQLVVACNDGKLLTVTSCSSCNKLDVIGDKNINDLVSANDFLVLVGDDFWFDILKSGNFRQYSISAKQALIDFNNGAYIVDVRTDDEYSQLHIKGSIHIPLDRLETELVKEIPDKSSEIIFYCSMGGRSQEALEKALLMGYKRVYNLGGIGDWPYETETGN